MKSDNPALNYAFLNPEFFETLDHYKPTPELIEHVRSLCGPSWKILPQGYWSYCDPGLPLGIQGWKIHISASAATALPLLSRIVPVCATDRVPFKFLSDLRMVRFSTSKSCIRASGGKFITIYPPDEKAFSSIIQRCDEATRDLVGPYILTDFPYRDSKVVFYRYGEHRGIGGVDASGRPVRAILSPGGDVILDKRNPLAAVPEWLTDPLGPAKIGFGAPQEMWLGQRRYRITGARRYSNFGGIYRGEDTKTRREVVIREARPHLGDPADPRQPQNLLRKQARIMEQLHATGLVPELIDLFDAQGHLFLVEEMLKGDNLWGYAMNFGHFVPTVDSRNLDTIIYHTARVLIEGLTEIHNHRIVLRDLTKSNVFFTTYRRVKFFDFEFSFELDGSDPPLPGGTEGYMSPEQRINATPTPAEDYYALGALLMDMIAFTATGLFVNRTGVLAALRQAVRDLGLPLCYVDAVEGLTAMRPQDRIDPMVALQVIKDGPRSWPLPESVETFVAPVFDTGRSEADVRLPEREPPSQELKEQIRATIDGITAYIRGMLRPLSEDALWPASPEMLVTNPVSLAFGASGILCYLNRIGDIIPSEISQWVINRATPRVCPPGLYIGLSGVALCLLQLGLLDHAEAVLSDSNDRPRILEIPGLYHGAAGWALANVIFWRLTGRRRYLDSALEIGWYLLDSAKRSAKSTYWESSGEVAFGLAFGASGIATLMISLNAASPEHRFLEAAEGALNYEMENARWSFGRIVWPNVKSASSNVPLTPHTRFGTAGVGTAAIRMYAATGEPRFRRIAEQCAFTACNRLGNKLWQDYGLSGLGEFMLDMFHYLSDETYLNTAYYLAEAILPHSITKPEGIAFAGSELLRISCDFGMGSAGIGWFLHRLLNPEATRLLFPHCLFDEKPASTLRMSVASV